MLVFKNVEFTDTLIEADAHMYNCLVGVHIIINRKKKTLEYDYRNNSTWIAQACWNLLHKVEFGEVKQSSTVYINWY